MTENLTDAGVLAASIDEPARFGVLFERHFDRIFSYVARRLGQEKAADVAAETFTVAFRRRGDYDSKHESALPWLYGIAGRLIRRHRLVEFRHLRALRSAAGSSRNVEVGEEIENRLDAVRSLPAVARAVRALSADERETLLLIAWGDLTYQQIATAMNVPIGTVRSRLNRARSRLRGTLAAQTIEFTGLSIPNEEGNHG